MNKFTSKDISYISLSLAFLIITSQLSIPFFNIIPITLQTLAIIIISLSLNTKQSVITILIYILIGCIGLPVFAGYRGGIATIVGPTGGFIIAFPIMSYLISIIKTTTLLKVISYIFIISIIHLLLGSIYFSFILKYTLYDSMKVCFIPFILPALIKSILGSIIGLRTKFIIK